MYTICNHGHASGLVQTDNTDRKPGLGHKLGLLRCPIGSVEFTDTDQAVGKVAVAASIPPGPGRADPGSLVLLDQLAGALEIGHQLVALGVEIRGDVVRDLAGQMAEPDSTIEADGAQP